MATKKLHFETLQLHVGQEQPDPATDARAVPIYQTTSYVFHNAQHAADRFGLRDAGNIYGRLTNSTQGVFEARVAALEGGVAGLAVASGAAAVTYALQNIVRAGDHIIAADNLYGGSFNLITHTLASQGITNTIINVNDLNALEAAIRENTKAIYVETFDQRFWTSAPLERVQKQLEIVNGYVGNLICFAYNHYNSPFVVNPAYHQAYLQYCRTGCLPIMDIPEKVKNAAVRKVAKGIEVSWIPNEMKAVDGYSIYRDGQLIMKLQIRDGQLPRTFVDAEGTVDNVYEVAVYNVIGKESAKVKAE